MIELVESTLQLSKVDLISTYGFKGERSGSIPATSVVQNDIIGPAVSDAQVIFLSFLTHFFFKCNFVYLFYFLLVISSCVYCLCFFFKKN